MSPDDGSGGTDEDPEERLNRELIELLNELRVALPGVQVLFASDAGTLTSLEAAAA